LGGDDHELLDGSRLTDGMKAGDILRDEYVLTLPALCRRELSMTVGLWNQRGGKSLDAQDAQGTPLGIRPVIDSIQVARNSTPFPLAYLTMEQPLTADMGEVKLLGLTTLPSQVAQAIKLKSDCIGWLKQNRVEMTWCGATLGRPGKCRVGAIESSRAGLSDHAVATGGGSCWIGTI